MAKLPAMTLFAQNTASKLQAYGWTHQDLAGAVGCQRSAISRALNGTHNPSLRFVEQVANALSCNVADLFAPNPEKLRH